MKTVFTLCAFMLALAAHSQAKYVDISNGNDNNSGNSTAAAWQTIQKAMDETAPGTTVFIRSGNYVEPGLQLNVSGTSGSEIVFKNYPGENPVIDGNNQPGTLLYIEDRSYFRIEGLTFTNAVGNFSIGVEITGNSHEFTFRKNHIHGIKWNAANTIPTSNDNANGLVIYGTTASGVYNFLIDSNEINNNLTGYSESLTLDGNVYNFQINANLVHDNSNIGIDCAGNYGVNPDPSLDQTRFGHIQDNVCYNNHSNYATSGGIYIDGARELYITRNLCYGNGYGIEIGAEEDGTTSGILVYDNLIYDNYEAGISVGGYDISTTGQVLNTMIRNNTIYNNTLGTNYLGEIYVTKASNVHFENNIIVAGNDNKLILMDPISPQANNVFEYNLWYSGSANENAIQAEVGGNFISTFQAMNTALNQSFSNYDDPVFTNNTSGNYNLRPLSSSPSINGGNPSVALYPVEKDFDFEPRISENRVDIGAYENNVVSLDEWSSSDFRFTIYPNPATASFKIDIENSALMEIYSLEGVLIERRKIDAESVIEIASYSSGVYLVKLNGEKGVASRFLVKN